MRVALIVVGALCVLWLAMSKFARAEAPRSNSLAQPWRQPSQRANAEVAVLQKH